MEGKINWLQHHLPDGLIVDAAWLEQRGYSGTLRVKYVKNGLLERVAYGVYRRKPAVISAEAVNLRWQQVVISLQSLSSLPVVVGGRTALEVQGLGHYATSNGPREIHLYSSKAVPPWVLRLKVGPIFVPHNSQRLFRSDARPKAITALLANGGKSPTTDSASREGITVMPWGQGDWPMILSSPERAILEMLDEVPGTETFHQADMLMDGLRNLSPRKLGKLLTDCRSVKVKRLFFWFAERHNHAWLKSIDRKGIDFGSGKRMLVRGGKLDTKFNITVPENLDAGG